MSGFLNWATSAYDWRLEVLAAVCFFAGVTAVALFARARVTDRRKDRRLAVAVNNMSQGLVMFDTAERMIVCNDRYIEMYGLSPQIVKPGCSLREIIANRIATGSLSEKAEEYRTKLLNAMARGETISWVVETKDGRSISVTNRPMAGGDWLGTHEDITERRRSERELESTKSFLDTVIDNVPVMITVKELPDLHYVLVNRMGLDYIGVARDRILGLTPADVYSKATADMITAHDAEAVQGGPETFYDVHPLATPGCGKRMVTSKRVLLPGEDGQPRYLLSVIEDVTERKRAEAHIEYLAHHDPLTRLPNRAAFKACLESTLARAEAAGESFAVLSIDLDRFKEINDVFGHATGDEMLVEIGRRLQSVSAGAFVARVGGDEFTLIGADGDQPVSAVVLAEKLLMSVDKDVEIGGHVVRAGMSIGVAIYPNDGSDAVTLLANAEAALYRAKAEGRGAIRYFEPKMDERLRDQRALQRDLQSAIERGEIRLHYQPQVRIDGGVIGFEALVRWHHPTRGNIPPATFIPLAEESGLIMALGEWVLREACREAASWPQPLQIAINLSPVQFRHGSLAGLVHEVLLESGLKPDRLELEITEGVLIGDFSRTVSILRRLKALGVRIAMDDFGTGYSSLSYLQSFPFDKIKIDRSFISNLTQSPQSVAIIRAVIGLGHGLGLPVTAEGVETQDQLEFLARESCDAVQGYLFGRPAPIAAFADMIGREAPAATRTA